MILKMGWFSDLEVQEICGGIRREENVQAEPSKWAETKNFENHNMMELSTVITRRKKQWRDNNKNREQKEGCLIIP